jgi:hypothetical protein
MPSANYQESRQPPNPPCDAFLLLPCAFSVTRAWSLDGAQSEALDEPPSNEEPDEDHWQNGDYTNRHQFTPVKTGLGHQLGGGDRNSLRSGAGERRSEGVVVPGEDKTKDGDGESPWSHQGHRNMKKGSKPAGPVDAGSFFQGDWELSKKSIIKPDGKRQIKSQVGYDQALDGVEEMETAKHYVQGNDDRSNRGHPGADNPERKMFLPGKVASRQPVPSKHPKNDRNKGGDTCC